MMLDSMKLVSKFYYGSFRPKLVPQILNSEVFLKCCLENILIMMSSMVTTKFFDTFAHVSVIKYLL